jgi:DNA-nicking Smr family endonuclease
MSGASDNDLPEAERRLFRESMEGVEPIESDRRAPDADRPRPSPRARSREADEAAARDALASGALDEFGVDPGEEIQHACAGVDERTLRRLRRGQYAMQAELDLHGYTRAAATSALRGFLADCRARGLTGVRIIHGKGRRSDNLGPVLKPAVARWLRRREEVLAFTSARPVDGGSGAVYVLLKRR